MSSIDTISTTAPLQYSKLLSTCPCCGYEQTSTLSTIGFDYWKGLVFKGDKRVWLEPMEADLLKIFLDSWPEIVSREKILLGLYGRTYRDLISSDNCGVFMSKLRRKLKTFDIGIQNINRRGWWLVKLPTGLHLNLRNKGSLPRPADKQD